MFIDIISNDCTQKDLLFSWLIRYAFIAWNCEHACLSMFFKVGKLWIRINDHVQEMYDGFAWQNVFVDGFSINKSCLFSLAWEYIVEFI